MGICHSQKKPLTGKSQPTTPVASSGMVHQTKLAPQLFCQSVTQPSQPRLKSAQNLTIIRPSNKSDIEIPSLLTLNKSPLLIHKEKLNAFDVSTRFFSKYSTLSYNENENSLLCQHNITAQVVKVTILDTNYEHHLKFFRELKKYNFNCSNICQYVESYKEKSQIYLVQEYCKGGLLSSLIQSEPISYDKAVQIIKQIIKAIDHLHQQKLTHGSLTIDSFSISDSVSLLVKLSDINPIFNHYQEEEGEDHLQRQKKIAKYTSPECERSMKGDVWAIGIIFHQLLTQCFPEKPTYEDNILIWSPTAMIHNVPCEAVVALRILLAYNPLQRTTLKNILQKDFLKLTINSETLQQIIINLANAKKMTQLQSAILFFMMNKFSKEEVHTLQKLFDEADSEGKELLNKSQLKTLYKTLIPDDEEFISSQIESLFQNLCLDNDHISINYFITAACGKKELLTDDNLEGCFKLLQNNNGGITAKSIARKMAINEAIIKEEILECVYDQIDLFQFKVIMKSLI